MVNTQTAFFIGPSFTYSARTGYYDFDEVKKSQKIDRTGLSMFGAIAGKRFSLGRYARMLIGAEFDFGAVIDDTLYYSIGGNPAPTEDRFRYYHFSMSPQLQFPFPALANKRVLPYVMIGGGMNYTYVAEHTYFLGDGEVIFQDQPYIDKGTFSADAETGIGFDWIVTRNATLTLAYSLSYWQPVRYSIQRDFPLNAQNYSETFLSHKVSVALLLEFK
jgi:hypothetical protein